MGPPLRFRPGASDISKDALLTEPHQHGGPPRPPAGLSGNGPEVCDPSGPRGSLWMVVLNQGDSAPPPRGQGHHLKTLPVIACQVGRSQGCAQHPSVHREPRARCRCCVRREPSPCSLPRGVGMGFPVTRRPLGLLWEQRASGTLDGKLSGLQAHCLRQCV